MSLSSSHLPAGGAEVLSVKLSLISKLCRVLQYQSLLYILDGGVVLKMMGHLFAIAEPHGNQTFP